MNDTQSRVRGRFVAGLVLVLLGILFLVAELFDVALGARLWPFLIIIPGLAFFVPVFTGGRSAGYFAIPGCILTVLGLLLLYQNLTGNWGTWTFAWSLVVPFSVGLGLLVAGEREHSQSLYTAGRWLTLVGIVLFLIFGAFFQLVLGIGEGTVGRILWPVLVILLGLYLLLRKERAS